jgi:hypothetical protein
MNQQMVTIPQKTLDDMLKRIKILETIVLKEKDIADTVQVYETEKNKRN